MDKEVNTDFLETFGFFDLMQRYRHAPLEDQKIVGEAFEEIKTLLKKKLEDAYNDGRLYEMRLQRKG